MTGVAEMQKATGMVAFCVLSLLEVDLFPV
jgi:hypothetical protein